MQEAAKAMPRFDALSNKFFYFFLEPLFPTVWGAYRMAIAGFVLLQYLVLLPDLQLFFGEEGLVLWSVIDNLVSPNLPTFGRISECNALNGMAPNALLYTMYALLQLSLILMFLGWRANLMAFFAWAIHMFFMHSSQLSAYGVAAFTNLALFFAVFSPINHALTPRRIRSGHSLSNVPTVWARVSLRALQLHLCIVYLATGIEKMMGLEWWNGNAIWYSLMEEQFNQFDFRWLASVPLLAKIMGWSVLLLETGYPIFIWLKPTRKYWLLGILGLHTGIAIFMGLHLFALIMVLLNLCAFGGILFNQIHQGQSVLFLKTLFRSLKTVFCLFGEKCRTQAAHFCSNNT